MPTTFWGIRRDALAEACLLGQHQEHGQGPTAPAFVEESVSEYESADGSYTEADETLSRIPVQLLHDDGNSDGSEVDEGSVRALTPRPWHAANVTVKVGRSKPLIMMAINSPSRLRYFHQDKEGKPAWLCLPQGSLAGTKYACNLTRPSQARFSKRAMQGQDPPRKLLQFG
eukprot:847949-Pelagomonas_calceolata.AAC.1